MVVKTSSSELKHRAKVALKGKYGLVVGIMLLMEVVVALLTFVMVFSMLRDGAYMDFNPYSKGMILYRVVFLVVMLFLSVIVNIGLLRLMLNICTGREYGIGDFSFVFRGHFWKFLGLQAIMMVIGLVLTIPGMLMGWSSQVTGHIPVIEVLSFLVVLVEMVVIAWISLALSQAIIMLVDVPSKGVFQCIKESWIVMKGNKWRLFCLYISFIGMFFLGLLSFGIGLLWIQPYIMCAGVYFYLDLKVRVPEPLVYAPYSQETLPYGPGTFGGQDAPAGDPGNLGGQDAPAGDPGNFGGQDAPAGDPGNLGGQDAPAGNPGNFGGQDAPTGDPGTFGGQDAPSKGQENQGGVNLPYGEPT